MFIGVIRDISDRKRSELLLKENADRLQAYHDSTESGNLLARALIDRQLMRAGTRRPAHQLLANARCQFLGRRLGLPLEERQPLCIARRCNRSWIDGCHQYGACAHAVFTEWPLIDTPHCRRSLAKSISSYVIPCRLAALSACPSKIDTQAHVGEVWIGGMPDVLLVNEFGSEVCRFSGELPLGIVDSTEIDLSPISFEWHQASQLVLFSDGLLEAENCTGEQFGETRLMTALSGAQHGGRRDAVQAALAEHLGQAQAQDDVSLLLLSCPGDDHAPNMAKSQADAWFFSLEKRSRSFGNLYRRFGRFRTIQQLNIRHRRIIANAEAALQDAQISAVAGGEARADFVEQFDDDFAITQAIKGQTAVGQRRLLAEGDQRLDDTAQFLGFRQMWS